MVINNKQSLRLFITMSIVPESGPIPFIFLIHILDLRPLSSINIMCKYADGLSQLCPKRSFVAQEEDFAHIQEWAQVKKLRLSTTI